jgi:NAD(P)-dependent dehydrogenase (short-subunit alcohol dehydrogenase family)
MGKLDGKVAIVTGAGRGIGRAIAEAYLQEGASVTITAARGQAELDQLAEQGWSEHVLALLADVTNQEACEQVVDQTIQRFGHVDVLVNNAGRGAYSCQYSAAGWGDQYRYGSGFDASGCTGAFASAGDHEGSGCVSRLGLFARAHRSSLDCD